MLLMIEIAFTVKAFLFLPKHAVLNANAHLTVI